VDGQNISMPKHQRLKKFPVDKKKEKENEITKKHKIN
jgi:hypothetical protein